jgi:hypothetical protein
MNIEELRSIIEETPEGATHIDSEQYYWKFDNQWKYFGKSTCGRWRVLDWTFDEFTRSLDDIKDTIEREDTIERLLLAVLKVTEFVEKQADKIAEMQEHMISNADCIDELIKLGALSSDPQVEMDAMTDSMRYIANKQAGDL